MAEAASAVASCVHVVLGSGLGSRGRPHLDPLEEEEERRDLCWGGDTASGSCSEAVAMADVGGAAVAGDPLASPGDPASAPGDGGSSGKSSAHAASSSAVADFGKGKSPSTGGAKAPC